jgi:hypothetical protein
LTHGSLRKLQVQLPHLLLFGLLESDVDEVQGVFYFLVVGVGSDVLDHIVAGYFLYL